MYKGHFEVIIPFEIVGLAQPFSFALLAVAADSFSFLCEFELNGT